MARLCPKCRIEMGPTYEPYELRCDSCGFWFDTYTGKHIRFDRPPEHIEFDGIAYEITGHRIGTTVEMSYQPRMVTVIVGYDRVNRHWLAQYIEPNGLDTYTVLTEGFLDYLSTEN